MCPGGFRRSWAAGLAARRAFASAAAGPILGGETRRAARLTLRRRRARGGCCARRCWQGKGLKSLGRAGAGMPAWVVGGGQAQEHPRGSVETFSLKSRRLGCPENGFSGQGSKAIARKDGGAFNPATAAGLSSKSPGFCRSAAPLRPELPGPARRPPREPGEGGRPAGPVRTQQGGGQAGRQGCPPWELCRAPPLPAPPSLPRERPCFNCREIP